MQSISRRLAALCVLALAYPVLATAAEPSTSPSTSPSALPKTYLAERGKLLVSDDLAKMGPQWRVAKGQWEPADGGVQVAEIPADKHGAVARQNLKFDDAIIQYSFKLDGAKGTSLSINTAKAHLCRVLVGPTGMVVRKDDKDKAGPDQAVVLGQVQEKLAPGEWHTLVVEIRGPEMLASLDGQQIAFGQHEAIAATKANFGLTVAGQSASFKDLRVWEALPNKEWEATKAELQKKTAVKTAKSK
jgi:hypothetical protein